MSQIIDSVPRDQIVQRVYCEPILGARQLGWVSCLASAGRVTLASGTFSLHIKALAGLTGTFLGVVSVTECLDL